MTKIQNLKCFEPEYWNFEFICYLGIVIWCFITWFSGFSKFVISTVIWCTTPVKDYLKGSQHEHY